jgi:hypothetical protein
MYSPATGTFLTRDSWQGDYNRPLSLNRWNYVNGNPINLMDPTGYGDNKYSSGGSKPCVLNDNEQFCVLNSGAFIDESHFGRSGHVTQTMFWDDLNHAIGKGPREISVPQSSMGYTYAGLYTVDIPMSAENNLPGIAVGIWLNYQQIFEKWLYEYFAIYLKYRGCDKRLISFGAHSAFETADIPSTYLGLVAAIYSMNYEAIVNDLGGGHSASSAPPGHIASFISEEEFNKCISSGCKESGSLNSSIFLKSQDNSGSYITLPYPDSIYIAPASNWEEYVVSYRYEIETPWNRWFK